MFAKDKKTASRKRKCDDPDVMEQARLLYIEDLKEARDLVHFARDACDNLCTDESYDLMDEHWQVGKKENVRTVLALAEGLRQRRLDIVSTGAKK